MMQGAMCMFFDVVVVAVSERALEKWELGGNLEAGLEDLGELR